MRLIMRVASGPRAGQSLAIGAGEVIRVGRSAPAEFVVDDDESLSRVHFVIECDATSCRVRDMESRNGTRVNGRLVKRATVQSGDAIIAGRTYFRIEAASGTSAAPARPSSQIGVRLSRPSTTAPLVAEPAARITPDSPATPPVPSSSTPSLRRDWEFTIGAWHFRHVPRGLDTVEQTLDERGEHIAPVGLRRSGNGDTGASVAATEEQLDEALTLEQYVERQLLLCRHFLADVDVDGPRPTNLAGAEEALELTIRHRTHSGATAVQRQLYARRDRIVGIVTFTASTVTPPVVREDFQTIVRGLGFAPSMR